jgi:flagellar basal-body rod modification protein FlgD
MNIASSRPAVGGFSDLYNPTGAAARPVKKTLDAGDFMKLLAVQFQRQDPMKPMEDTAFIAQMAEFTALEQTKGMSADLARLRAEQQLIMGNGYLGRTVTVEDADGGTLAGEVSAVENTPDGVRLVVAGASYPLAAVRRVETTPLPLR